MDLGRRERRLERPERFFALSSSTRLQSPTVIRNDEDLFPNVPADLNQFLGCPAFSLASLSSLASMKTISVARFDCRSSAKTVCETLHSKTGIFGPLSKKWANEFAAHDPTPLRFRSDISDPHGPVARSCVRLVCQFDNQQATWLT